MNVAWIPAGKRTRRCEAGRKTVYANDVDRKPGAYQCKLRASVYFGKLVLCRRHASAAALEQLAGQEPDRLPDLVD